MKNFENSTTCWICDNFYVEGDVKVRDHCHVTEKYVKSSYGYYNIKVKLNHNISTVFRIQKNYDSQLIMQEICIFNLKVNVIRNEF